MKHDRMIEQVIETRWNRCLITVYELLPGFFCFPGKGGQTLARLDPIKIRTALYKQELTQSGLARKVGLCRGTISAACRGASTADSTAEKIAEGLNMTISELS